MSRTKKLALMAIITAASLCVFVLEAQLPPLVPVPGVKLGLANIFTLFAFYVLQAPSALAILLVRVVLGSLITGQVSALGYSLCGGLLSYLVLFTMNRFFSRKQIWALSIFCAIAHNLGQVLLAAAVMGTIGIFWYVPALVLSALITGCFTGLVCQLILTRLKESNFM